MLRLLLLIVLAYFVFRAARNLWQAATRPPEPPPMQQMEWKRDEAPVRVGWQDEVEEARYRDL